MDGTTAGDFPRRPTVLVVDDDASTRARLVHYLQPEYDVHQATHGAEAVELIARESVHLIISDVWMPKMDGLELTRHLKSSEDTAEIPIILVTATPGEEAVRECLESGADDYLRKPVQRVEFVARVASARRQAAATLTRRAALAELERTKETLQLTLQLAADAIIGFGRDGHIETLNQAARRLFPQLNASPLPDIQGVLDEQVLRTTGGDPWATSVRIGGKEHHLEVSVGATQTVDFRVAVIRDITARVMAERELIETKEALRDSSHLADQAQMATGILHNIGNVLNSIGVSLEARSISEVRPTPGQITRLWQLLTELEDSLTECSPERAPVMISYVQKLSKEATLAEEARNQELLGLREKITHVQSLVKQQQGSARGHGARSKVSVEKLMTLATEIAGFKQGASRIRKTIECPTLEVDENRLLEVLVNLLKNAAEASAQCPEPEIELQALDCQGQRVRFVVRDNGVGMSKDQLTRLFQRGFTTKEDGHGFGLHSCRRTAELLGGTLEAASAGLGNGSTFTLELPRCPAQSQGPH